VQQGVGAADIDERAVIGQAADLALHDVAFFEFRVAALLAGAFFVLRNGAAIDTTSSSSTSSLMIRQRISCSTSFSISDASWVPLREAA